MRTMARLWAALALMLVHTDVASAGPGDPVGSAVRVVNKVTAEANAAERSLAQGDGVKQDEIIAVAPDSLGELRLLDETKVALGPGSRLKLDKFVYDAEKSSGAIAVDLTKGAFRFITGLAKKPSYLIRSPSASISVRGTIFDVYVESNGTMWVLLHEGSIQVCNSANVCRVVNNPCGVVRVGPGGELSAVATWNRQPFVSEIDFATAFPFVVQPPQFDPTPRFTRANVEAGTCVADDIPPPDLPRRADAPGGSGQGGVSPPPAQQTVAPPEETYAPEAAYAAPAAQPVSRPWSGFYAGVTLGAAYSPGDTEVACDDPGASFDGVAPNCGFAIAIGALETRYDTSHTGVIGGGTLGMNWRSGNVVLGVEGDMTATSLDGKDRAIKNVPPVSPGDRKITQELEWLATIRARAGFVNGNWLLYGTAGLALGEVEYGYSAEYSGGFAFAKLREREIEVGWTAGVGAEVDLGIVTLKGEYLFFDLGDADFKTPFIAPLATPVAFEPKFENQGHVARIGINFPLD